MIIKLLNLNQNVWNWMPIRFAIWPGTLFYFFFVLNMIHLKMCVFAARHTIKMFSKPPVSAIDVDTAERQLPSLTVDRCERCEMQRTTQAANKRWNDRFRIRMYINRWNAMGVCVLVRLRMWTCGWYELCVRIVQIALLPVTFPIDGMTQIKAHCDLIFFVWFWIVERRVCIRIAEWINNRVMNEQEHCVNERVKKK